MFDGLRESLSEALGSIKNMDPSGLKNAIRHPRQVKKLMAEREATLLYWKNDVSMIPVGAIRYSNLVFSPELCKGWFVLPNSEYEMTDSGATFVVHKDIPYTLGISKEAKTRDINEELEEADRKKLGLPEHLLKATTDSLGELCMTKWNESMMESRGSNMVFIFGTCVGLGVGSLLWLLIMMIGGMAS